MATALPSARPAALPTAGTTARTTPATVLLNRLLARGKFRHVQVLLRVAELGSVQRAGEAIGLTQSAVTQTLAYLEALLDVRLFHRHARGVTPTPACIDLLPVARQVMKGVAETADVLVARQRRGGGIVRVLTSSAAVNSLLLEALPRFHESHPTIQVHLQAVEGEDQLLAVARGEVDLAACRLPVGLPEGWVFEPLVEDRFVVVCHPQHAVLRRRRPEWKALARETWLLASAETAARVRFDGLASLHFGAEPKTHPLVSRVLSMMTATLLREPVLALLPLSVVRPMVDSGQLVLVPLPEALPMAPLGLLRPEKEASEAAEQFMAHLRQWTAAAPTLDLNTTSAAPAPSRRCST